MTAYRRCARRVLLVAVCAALLAMATGCAAGADGTLTVGYKAKDMNDQWSADSCTPIDLNAGGVTITGGGDYLLTGTLNGGSVTIDAGKGDDVRLILAGADITGAGGPAINCRSADKLIITLAGGTTNRLADAPQGDEDAEAVLYADCDLSINGGGALTVEGSFEHGIMTRDDLKITGGSITVSAPGDALRGRDGTAICGGVLTLNAGDDGIQANNDEAADKGWVVIEGGSVTITARDKGIAAETVIQLTGGDVTIDAADDGLNCGRRVLIAGGALGVTAGNVGVHADDELTVSAGTIVIPGCEEGLEAGSIVISGGETHITSADDGINASTGDDSIPASMAITGGTVRVSAEGDGLDANGSIAISGGVTLISGPVFPGNGALDYDDECIQTGGVLVAAGAADMACSVSPGSAQASVMVVYAQPQDAGARVTLTGADGAVLASFAPEKEYRSVVICAPGMAQGGAYTLFTGGEAADGSGGVLTGGQRLGDIAMTAAHMQVNPDGSAYSAPARRGRR